MTLLYGTSWVALARRAEVLVSASLFPLDCAKTLAYHLGTVLNGTEVEADGLKFISKA